ncbi:signal peptidase II [bacterium]|nr:signal peptidase II [bacterium]
MKNITWRYIGVFVLVAVFTFVIDRIAKVYFIGMSNENFEIIPNIFAISVQENPGIAFSIQLPYIVQIVLTPLLIIVGLKFAFDYLQMNKNFVLITLGFVVGGAMSNYVDRILYHAVIDYLSFWSYPVFNVADSFIVIGIFLIAIFYGKIKRV